MKWIWLFFLVVSYFAFYLFCWCVWATNFDAIGYPMIIGVGTVMMLITKSFIDEYF